MAHQTEGSKNPKQSILKAAIYAILVFFLWLVLWYCAGYTVAVLLTSMYRGLWQFFPIAIIPTGYFIVSLVKPSLTSRPLSLLNLGTAGLILFSRLAVYSQNPYKVEAHGVLIYSRGWPTVAGLAAETSIAVLCTCALFGACYAGHFLQKWLRAFWNKGYEKQNSW